MTRLDDNKRVKELENELMIMTNINQHQYVPLIKELTYENQKHKRTLEQVREMSKDSIIDKKYFDVVDRALKGELE